METQERKTDIYASTHSTNRVFLKSCRLGMTKKLYISLMGTIKRYRTTSYSGNFILTSFYVFLWKSLLGKPLV